MTLSLLLRFFLYCGFPMSYSVPTLILCVKLLGAFLVFWFGLDGAESATKYHNEKWSICLLLLTWGMFQSWLMVVKQNLNIKVVELKSKITLSNLAPIWYRKITGRLVVGQSIVMMIRHCQYLSDKIFFSFLFKVA